jgi:hypothetical protein
VDCPLYPWPFAGRGTWRSGPPLGLASDARDGGNRVIAYPAVDSDPNAHARALSVRAAWLARPSHRAPLRDAARLTGRREKVLKMGMKGG